MSDISYRRLVGKKSSFRLSLFGVHRSLEFPPCHETSFFHHEKKTRLILSSGPSQPTRPQQKLWWHRDPRYVRVDLNGLEKQVMFLGKPNVIRSQMFPFWGRFCFRSCLMDAYSIHNNGDTILLWRLFDGVVVFLFFLVLLLLLRDAAIICYNYCWSLNFIICELKTQVFPAFNHWVHWRAPS